VPAERVSVVVLFNHLSDAQAAAMALLAAVLGEPAETPPGAAPPMPPWAGVYLEPETGLSVRIDSGPAGKVSLRYDRHPDLLEIQPDGTAGTDGPRLRPGPGGLWMDRPGENQSSLLTPCDGPGRLDVAGRFRCGELESDLTVVDAGGALYGAFSGFLGQGRMELLDPVGADVWALPCPRALDHTPPGDWTLAFRRDDSGRVVAARVGCWLARRIDYERVGASATVV
jgi:D-aminopeptidase